MLRMVKTVASAVALLMLMGTLAACAPAAQTPAAPAPTAGAVAPATALTAAKKLDVVATTSILADITRNVAGDAANVTALVPIGGDPHTFEPSPRDSQRVAVADVLIENGVDLEKWLEPIIKNSGTTAKPVAVSEGLKLREGEEEHGHETAAKKDAQATPATAAEPEHEFDPHLWTDVQNVIAYVERIRAGLAAADPANAATYKANADKYTAQLKELDASIVQQTASLPLARRKLVTNHETFGYFAERYGYEIVGSVLESVSTEAQPSARDIARLVDAIKEAGVPAVFTESTTNPALAAQIARDAGVKVVTDLYTDSLGAPGSPGDTYIKMMRHNIEQIVKALQ